jgi:hypothetical protein
MKKFFSILVVLFATMFVYAGSCVQMPDTGIQAVNALKNQQKPVSGFFVQVGNGPFDWIYIGADGSYVAKLEGIDSNNYFKWTFLYGYGGKDYMYW